MLPAEMPGLDPSQHRILLVGPRVIHLKPFFERRRYSVVAVQKGVEGMGALDAEPQDIVILELNLGDLTATEFLMAARQAHPGASFLLLDDASKAGQIVKALQAGLDGYLPTPPDEDRLFFEVERHLRRSGNGNGNTNGATNGDSAIISSSSGSGAFHTMLTERPDDLKETTELQTQLAERESQLVALGMQTDFLHQEISKLREESKKFQEVRGALIGQIEGDLDEEQAYRLKARLAMASVIETEVDTLRQELGGARTIRRGLEQENEILKKRVLELSSPQPVEQEPTYDGAADRADVLEADNLVLAARVEELEEEVDLTKAEVVALEQKQREEVAGLERQLNRLSSDQALRANEDDKIAMEHMAAIARLQQDYQKRIDRLKEEHEAALTQALSDGEIDKASAHDRMDDAVARALFDQQRAHIEQLSASEQAMQGKLDAALGKIQDLRRECALAISDKESAVGKALDIELILDELTLKIEYLEGEVETERERATKAESDFKKDKLRLIQEKEAATSGSQQVSERVQRIVADNAALKKAHAELEATLAALEERANMGDEIRARAEAELVQATLVRSEALQQSEAAARALQASEERARFIEQQLAETTASFEAELEQERARRETADRALLDVAEAANRLADARAAAASMEIAASRLQHRLDEAELGNRKALEELAVSKDHHEGAMAQLRTELERTRTEHEAALAHKAAELDAQRELAALEQNRMLAQARADVDEATAQQRSNDELVIELRTRIASVEDSALERDALSREEREAAAQAIADGERQRAEIVEHYQARLRDALAGSSTSSAEVMRERDAYRARLAETEAWVQQAQLHLEALRVERDQLAAQATALANDAQGRGAETHELHAQLLVAQQQVAELTHRAAGFEHEVALARHQAQRAATNASSATEMQAFAILQDEAKGLRVQLQQAQQQAQRSGGSAGGVGNLPEELEPLRWTLTAAIDALTSLEQREPALAAHLRNLRLLASTLQKLSS